MKSRFYFENFTDKKNDSTAKALHHQFEQFRVPLVRGHQSDLFFRRFAIAPLIRSAELFDKA